jgi:hypothetical protein
MEQEHSAWFMRNYQECLAAGFTPDQAYEMAAEMEKRSNRDAESIRNPHPAPH